VGEEKDREEPGEGETALPKETFIEKEDQSWGD
jgi:hypothetical protein